MDERDAAQAAELVRALRNRLQKMTRQLAWLERQDVASWTSRASAIRSEAAALRRDINEAQTLIDRLERRYLNGDGHAQPRLPS
jgi:chromosome segregation ATPase